MRGGSGGAVIPRELNAAQWFVDRHVEEGRAGQLAIICEGRRLTYGDVYAGANRSGNMLRRLGVTMEQRVVLLLPDGPEFVWSFWGALKIGAVPVPTNTLLKPRDYEYILRDSRARVAIASEPQVGTFSVAKLFFAYGLGNALYFPFHVGASTVLYPGRPEPTKVFEVIARDRPTLFYAVPTAYAAMLQVPDAERAYDVTSLRLCRSAAEPLPRAIHERWREKLWLAVLDGVGSARVRLRVTGN